MGDADASFIEEHTRFVRGVATHLYKQLGLECDMEDLVAFGFTGLLEARERYEAREGVAFKTFAYYRVRGAMVDGIRAMAYLPRRAHARLRAAEVLDAEAEAAGAQRASASAQASAPAQDTSQALRALDGVLGRVAAAYCVASCLEGEDGDPQATPERSLQQKQARDRVREALASLPERERFLAQGHYIHGRRLDELAAELGLSKSWGSRLHSRALQLLRERLGEP
jgi:RNA polymerase sigma factor for flagellar operon FliA